MSPTSEGYSPVYFLGREHRYDPPALRDDLRKLLVSSMSQDESMGGWPGLDE